MRSKKFSVGLKVAVAILSLTFVTRIWAQTPTGEGVLINFAPGTKTSPGYGSVPYGTLIGDSNGNLYGTTSEGGKYGYGTVYELVAKSGGGFKKQLLYSFCAQASCSDGATPIAGVILYNGSLYGTTEFGGQGQAVCVVGGVEVGCGVVFELSPGAKPTSPWKETVLEQFPSASQGYPTGSVVFDSSGNLYGTTSGGEFAGEGFECNGSGTIFELQPTPATTPPWTYIGLASDVGCPFAGLTYYNGNLFGTDSSNPGAVFELTPMAGGGWNQPAILHTFTFNSTTDGAMPFGGVTFDNSGNLYGTTLAGGDGAGAGKTSCGSNPYSGCGTVYELSAPFSAGMNDTLRYSFGDTAGDGWNPYSTLIFDPTFTYLYGTTSNGGSGTGGTVFMLSPPTDGQLLWSDAELISFNYFGNAGDVAVPGGTGPVASLFADSHGNLYGTTAVGGTDGVCQTQEFQQGAWPGCGVVFDLGPSISPTTANFSYQLDFKPSAAKTLTLENLTTGALTINGAAITGTNAADFQVTGGTCVGLASLALGAHCSVTVVFTPSLAGPETAILNVTDSDGMQSAALKGTGYDAFLSPLSGTFGKVAVGSSGTPITLTMTNVSTTATLTYAGIAFDGGGTNFAPDPTSTCNTTTSGGSLAPGASCTVVVDFTPTGKGSYMLGVEFTDNGDGAPNFEYKQIATLTGTGT